MLQANSGNIGRGADLTSSTGTGILQGVAGGARLQLWRTLNWIPYYVRSLISREGNGAKVNLVNNSKKDESG